MNPDGGVIVAEEDTRRVLLVSPSGETRILVSTKAGLNSPSAVGLRKDFLYVQDDKAIYKVSPDVHSLTSKNATFQFVQAVSAPDQPFVKLTSPKTQDRFSRDQAVEIAWVQNLRQDGSLPDRPEPRQRGQLGDARERPQGHALHLVRHLPQDRLGTAPHHPDRRPDRQDRRRQRYHRRRLLPPQRPRITQPKPPLHSTPGLSLALRPGFSSL